MNETPCTTLSEKQYMLLKDIILSVTSMPDAPLLNIVLGDHLIAITSIRTGLSTRSSCVSQSVDQLQPSPDDSVHAYAQRLLQPTAESSDDPSYAMAAVNSLIPIPNNTVPVKAQDLLIANGRGKNAAVIGRFSFIDRVRDVFNKVWVLERKPKPGDLPAEAAFEILPQADVVAMTATTLLNGSCADLLSLIPPNAFTIMLGPTTPFLPCLFDWGIDALAGCVVVDTPKVLASVRDGLPSKYLEGLQQISWVVRK